MDDNAVLKLYSSLNKTQIINGYKKYLEENKRFRKRNDGIRGKPSKLERPKIGEEVYSWKQFKKLPKASIIVYTFSQGCDVAYLSGLLDNGYFEQLKIEKAKAREQRTKIPSHYRKHRKIQVIEMGRYGKMVSKYYWPEELKQREEE